MRRLFLKVFLSFWMTVILTGISLVLAFALQPQGVPSRWHAGLEDTVMYSGAVAAGAFEQGGATAASEYISRLSEDAHIHACIFDGSGNALAGEYCSEFTGIAARIARNAHRRTADYRGTTKRSGRVRDGVAQGRTW
jgi:hypothetical protein